MSHWAAEWSFAALAALAYHAYSALLPPVIQKVSICPSLYPFVHSLAMLTLLCCAFSHKLPITAASAEEATLVQKGRQAVLYVQCQSVLNTSVL